MARRVIYDFITYIKSCLKIYSKYNYWCEIKKKELHSVLCSMSSYLYKLYN